jgi:tetratricopeptide (TPR) repeat protein
MRVRARILAAALAICAVPALVGAQHAPAANSGGANDVESARRYFKAGVDLYREGDLAASLVEFKRAYAAAPNSRLLYNLGQVSQELREYPDAQRYFQQYLREGGDSVEPARKHEVSVALVKLYARIAQLALTSEVAETEFFVDDVSVGHGPFEEPVLVNAGRRRISATAEGRARVTRVVDAPGGELLEVHFEFPDVQPATAAAPPALVDPAPAGRSSSPGPALWIGVGAGVLAVGAGVLAYLAVQDGADYRDALERKISASELESLHDRATTKALATDILLGAALVSGGLAVYFALSDRAPDRRAAARLSVGAGQLRIDGRF